MDIKARDYVAAGQTRGEAIACNALIDGLWVEGSLLPAAFAPGEVITIGLRSVGAILGVDLLAHTAMLPDFGNTLP
jgi:hypothetical protein